MIFMSEEDEIGADLGKGAKKASGHVSIAIPMAIWIALLAIGLLFKAILTLTATTSGLTFTILGGISGFILNQPGILILPIIMGAIIGTLVGKSANGAKKAARAGLLNGIYCCFVYLVVIAVIYLVMFYSLAGSQPDNNFLLQFWIAIPAGLLIATSIIFASLSYLRKII